MQPLALFSLDDTLVNHQGAFNAWVEEFCATHQLGERELTFISFFHQGHTDSLEHFFTEIRKEFDLSEPPDRMLRQYLHRLPELVRCQPKDIDALELLRSGGWKIGIVANGPTDHQLAKIKKSGLSGLVDAWGISEQVGLRKPNPEIFHHVARLCGADPTHGGWMIGNDLPLDITGAHAAGLQTIWLAPRRHRTAFVGPAPDLMVDSVAEAVEAILHNS